MIDLIGAFTAADTLLTDNLAWEPLFPSLDGLGDTSTVGSLRLLH